MSKLVRILIQFEEGGSWDEYGICFKDDVKIAFEDDKGKALMGIDKSQKMINYRIEEIKESGYIEVNLNELMQKNLTYEEFLDYLGFLLTGSYEANSITYEIVDKVNIHTIRLFVSCDLSALKESLLEA